MPTRLSRAWCSMLARPPYTGRTAASSNGLPHRPLQVGALDAPMAELCHERGIAAATIPPRTLSARGLSAHSQQLSQSSGYYRYQPGTFLRMGLVKELFIRQVLMAGFDAMVSDVDVVWLRPPWPLVRYSPAGPPVEPEAALLALADVILSVDQVCSTLSFAHAAGRSCTCAQQPLSTHDGDSQRRSATPARP